MFSVKVTLALFLALGLLAIAGAWPPGFPIVLADTKTNVSKGIRTGTLYGRTVLIMKAGDLKKWAAVRRRHTDQTNSPEWRALVAELASKPPAESVRSVNLRINQVSYAGEPKDVWRTPTEFLRSGGDCEEYAFTKMLLLRALGVPASSMHVIALAARPGLLAHMVLVVETERGPMVMDNLRRDIYPLGSGVTSRMVFALNEQKWWLAIRGRSDVATSANPSRE